VGSNDLTQYLLAVDRNNPRVADLYHTYHPALLQALRQIVVDADAAGCPLSICGEMAGDPLSALLLVGLGYRVLSMSATSLLRVKAMLRQVPLSRAEELAHHALTLADNTQIRDHLEGAFNDPGITRLYRHGASRLH
jgi:phosphotransferase system enzyme I (PtsP)